MKTCSINGCKEKHEAKGYCKKHYLLFLRKRPEGLCSIEGCDKKIFIVRLKLCGMHYARFKAGKDILAPTRYSPSEININGNVAIIKLYDIKHKEVGETLIDSEDVDKVKNIKWALTSHGYVFNTSLRKYLHSFIINNSGITDHIDGNKLNNTKSNLRVCTQSQNTWNVGLTKNNKSGFKGVSWDNIKNKWAVWIKAGKIHKCVGRFNEIEEAANCAKETYNKYHGEYSYYKERDQVINGL